jgi:hypothetical protein
MAQGMKNNFLPRIGYSPIEAHSFYRNSLAREIDSQSFGWSLRPGPDIAGSTPQAFRRKLVTGQGVLRKSGGRMQFSRDIEDFFLSYPLPQNGKILNAFRYFPPPNH